MLGLASTRHRRSIIFRREYSQLKGLLERAQEIYFGHGKFNGQDLSWRDLPGDRKIEFGAVQNLGDERKFQGRPHDGVFLDELTHFHECQFWFLTGWLRTTIPGQRCRVAVTFNPPTHARERWVTEFFAPWLDRKHPNPAMPGEIRWYARIKGQSIERPDGEPFEHEGETLHPLSRTFFPARLVDNPRLAATNYGAQLQSLPEPLRSQLAYGDFDAGVEDDPWQLIPTRWVDAAMARWNDRKAEGKMTMAGVDVAHGGKDKTVIASRFGDYFASLHKHPGISTPDGKTAASLVAKAVDKDTPTNVDAIGYGASCAERCRDKPPEGHGLNAVAVNVATASRYRDRSGRYRMINVRAEMYWRLREALDPEFGSTMALPPDPELLADLTAINYEITPSGIKIESKDAIKEKLSGRSPDVGDAVALCMLEQPSFAFL